ncbi:MAG: hypothetical protein EXS09_16480 [Gemmataceae bacterium]|nr:hypothetical protein [Gemmataceae bacterium]
MTSTEWIATLRLVPEAEHGKLVIVLSNGSELCVDTLCRYESNFLVIRGRTGGTIDEARGFFIPYNQMVCLRIDRSIKIEELEAMFGPSDERSTSVAKETPLVTASRHPTPPAPTDPAEASRLLLDRIRMVRATSTTRLASR